MEGRLCARYVALVKEHMRTATSVASGLASLPGEGKAASCAQAMWRFLSNDRVTLPALAEPPREVARQVVNADAYASGYVLLVHDWSKLTFKTHTSKEDQVAVSHSEDVGYELTTSLLVDAERGCPLAPMEMQLWAADGLHTTRQETVADRVNHLAQVLPSMRASRTWGLRPRIVHVIDRESDSLVDWREWHGEGHLFLSRSDRDRTALWQGRSLTFLDIGRALETAGAFRRTRSMEHRGKPASLFVAETTVAIEKAGRRRTPEGRVAVPGPPLTLRLILTEVRDENGGVLARWYLVTNLFDAEVTTDTIALWYYWRWRIETYFKLLKSAGLQLEHWRQESAKAIVRRLLVASMSCVLVWQLERNATPAAEQCKALLMRLSGRQTKRSRAVTATGLLTGLERWFAVRELLKHHSLEQIDELVKHALPLMAPADTS